MAVSRIVFRSASERDAPALAALHNEVAADLTTRFGEGHWARLTTEKGMLRRIADSRTVVALDSKDRIAGTLELVTKKPWAIDRAYFTPVKRPLYLLNMAVAPGLQRNGIGRRLLAEAAMIARGWPAQSICLDAYDAAAGAGDFYARCGYREVGRKTYRGVPLVYYEHLIDA